MTAAAVLPASQRLALLRANGLRCAVSLGIPGLSQQDKSGYWRGLDTDFARAVATAVCGDPDAVQWIPTAPADRLSSVIHSRADLGVCNASWTFSRDAEVLFAGVLCHDGEGFLVRRGEVESLQALDERPVAVQSGTTTVANLEHLAARGGPRLLPVPAATPELALTSYLTGTCHAYVLDRTALAGIRSQLSDPSAHLLLPEAISEEPLSPFVAGHDPHLFRIVRLTLMVLIAAEGQAGPAGGSRDWASLLAAADLAGPALGLDERWASRVVGAVGHYGEIYERNLGNASALNLPRGLNTWTARGGALFAPHLF